MEIINNLKDTEQYLPLSGGTVSGDITSNYIMPTWVQLRSTTDLGSIPTKYAVVRNDGWIYTRTLEETKSDLGLNNVVTLDSNGQIPASYIPKSTSSSSSGSRSDFEKLILGDKTIYGISYI